MPKIYLARHGQDEDNVKGILNGHRDMPLTAIGLQQSEILATNIFESKLNITKVYSSPLQRAYKTAEVVADKIKLSRPEKLDLLIERDFGVMTGKPVTEIELRCAPDILKCNPITYFLNPEGAETFPQLIVRAKQLLHFIERNSENETVLLVSHGDIGKMIYAAFYRIQWQIILEEFHFGNSELLLLDQNSLPEERRVFTYKQHNH